MQGGAAPEGPDREGRGASADAGGGAVDACTSYAILHYAILYSITF